MPLSPARPAASSYANGIVASCSMSAVIATRPSRPRASRAPGELNRHVSGGFERGVGGGALAVAARELGGDGCGGHSRDICCWLAGVVRVQRRIGCDIHGRWLWMQIWIYV